MKKILAQKKKTEENKKRERKDETDGYKGKHGFKRERQRISTLSKRGNLMKYGF